MSLDTLLAAAWFVEQQDAQRSLLQTSTLGDARDFQQLEFEPKEEQVDDKPPDQVSPEHEDCSSSTATSLPATTERDKQSSSPVNSNGLSKSQDNLAQLSTWVEEKEYLKRVAGTREVHNKLEKNRRAHLKECFEILKKQLPPCPEEKKSSNLSILHSALRHIQSLRRREREYEHEMERLAREKISAQQKLAMLKKELSSQWDHIDFTTLLPDVLESDEIEIKEEQVSISTSTASEEGLDHMTSQMYDDDDEDCDVDILSDSDDACKLNSNTSSLSSFAMPCSPSGESLVEVIAVDTKPSSNGSIPVSAHVVSVPRVNCSCNWSPQMSSVANPIIQMISSPVPVDQPLALTVNKNETVGPAQTDSSLLSPVAVISDPCDEHSE